jgi:hypothetical protein
VALPVRYAVVPLSVENTAIVPAAAAADIAQHEKPWRITGTRVRFIAWIGDQSGLCDGGSLAHPPG